MSRELPHLLIAGSRLFRDYPVLCERLDAILGDSGPWVVVSGGAAGADELGERWAALNGYEILRFDADWDTHGDAAGPIRNGWMVDFLSKRKTALAVLFWDGESRGTADTMKRLRKAKIKTHVVEYTKIKVIRENRDQPEREDIINPGVPMRKVLYKQSPLTPEEKIQRRPKNVRKSIKGRPRKKKKG